MKHLYFVLLLILPLICGAKSQFNEIQKEQHKAMHRIIMLRDDSDDYEDSLCTAYAISPHVLLTAAHCNVQDAIVEIDPICSALMECDNYVRTKQLYGHDVKAKFYDHKDHMLLVVPTVKFEHTIIYDPNTYDTPEQGDYLYSWGNQYPDYGHYRRGKVLGIRFKRPLEDVDSDTSLMFLSEMEVRGGDSGSAVFDAKDNRLVLVITYQIYDDDMGAYPLDFSSEQVHEAESIKGRGDK